MAKPFLEIVIVHAVMSEIDDKSMGGAMAYFTNYGAAAEYAKGKGYYGGDAPLREVPLLRIDIAAGPVFYAVEDVEPIDVDLKKAGYDEALRNKTIAKLSPEELRVLGLTGVK